MSARGNGIVGKVVVITGAGSGIGEAAARLLAERGAKVVLGGRRTDRLEKIAAELQGRGHTAVAKALDVTQLSQMQAFVNFALETFDKLDVLINNAGVMPLSKLEALKIAEWDRMIDVN